MKPDLEFTMNGLQVWFMGTEVRYVAADGVWHKTTWDKFLKLLRKSFRPKKQKV